MSLRDQFLKSGLITKQQANKLIAEKNKQEHILKKDKNLSQAIESEKQKLAAEMVSESEKQKQIDRELNKQRDQMLANRENIFRARQLINSNAQNQKSAPEFYFFGEGKYVRKVSVTPWQREMLARGAFGIVRPDENVDDFVIIPRETTKILLDICPDKIIVLHSELQNSEEVINHTER